MDQEVRHDTVFDSDQLQIGEVYARALLDLGRKDNQVDQMVEQLDAVVAAIEDLPAFRAALESPRIPLAEKLQMLEKAFRDKVHAHLLNFLKVVARKGRLDCLPAIRVAAHRLHDEIAGRVQVRVTTAVPVPDATRQTLQQRLSEKFGKTAVVHYSVDPKIIGGLVVRVGDTVYDASVATQLKSARTRTIKRAVDAIRESVDKFLAS